jgi:hypothetical protein
MPHKIDMFNCRSNKNLTDDQKTIIARFRIHDESVPAKLRLSANWSIRRPVYEIQYTLLMRRLMAGYD